MNLITRDTINKNLKVTSLQLDSNFNVIREVVGYESIIRKIDILKNYLLEVKNAKPGQKVIMANFFWPDYLAWYFACAELGIIFVVSDYPKSEATLKKLEIYGDIDYIIYDHHCPPGFINLKEKLIDSNYVFQTYFDNSKTPILVNEESVFMLSTSSGTTGTPKLISHTHGFFASLLERNASLYNLKPEQKCFHSKGLHHGSVTGVYFLPTIKYCSHHYHAPFKFLPSQQKNDYYVDTRDLVSGWVKMIQDEKINMCLMFYDQIECLTEFLQLGNKKHDDLTIYVLSKVKPDVINKLVGEFHYTIKSIFGCTETSGPLFLPEINKDNYQIFDSSNCGKPLDDYYNLSINDDNLLEVGMPDKTTIIPGDKFIIHNGDYIFKGRENLYRIKGQTFYLDFFNDTIEQLTPLKRETDFDVIVDQDYQKIYIRLTNDYDIHELNKKLGQHLGTSDYYIHKKIVHPRQNFFSGIKFDPESIRIVCRQL